MPQSGKVI